MKIAFDLEATIMNRDDSVQETMVNLIKILKTSGNFIILWSTSDRKYIANAVKEFNLDTYVDLITEKMNVDLKNIPDVVFDSESFEGSSFTSIRV